MIRYCAVFVAGASFGFAIVLCWATLGLTRKAKP